MLRLGKHIAARAAKRRFVPLFVSLTHGQPDGDRAMKRLQALPFLLFFLSAPLLNAQFTDDFESYEIGDLPVGDIWVDFGGTLAPEISDDQASGGTQSLKLTLNPAIPNPAGIPGYGSDVFTDFAPAIEEGVWNLSFDHFVPSEFNGVSLKNFSEQDVGTGFFDFGAQLVTDARTEFDLFVYQNQEEFATLPLIRDQ